MSRTSSRHRNRYKRDLGLLIIRIAIGGSILALHGIPKLFQGPETWEKVGLAMSNIGINFLTPAWGFLAAMTESIGAALIILGLFTRPVSIMLAFTMLIAMITHLRNGDTMMIASHPMELMFVFIALALTGAGSFSFDKK